MIDGKVMLARRSDKDHRLNQESIAMIRPDFAKWGQTAEDLGRLSIETAHVRSRERFQELYKIGTHQQNASEWAHQIGRRT